MFNFSRLKSRKDHIGIIQKTFKDLNNYMGAYNNEMHEKINRNRGRDLTEHEVVTFIIELKAAIGAYRILIIASQKNVDELKKEKNNFELVLDAIMQHIKSNEAAKEKVAEVLKIFRDVDLKHEILKELEIKQNSSE